MILRSPYDISTTTRRSGSVPRNLRWPRCRPFWHRQIHQHDIRRPVRGGIDHLPWPEAALASTEMSPADSSNVAGPERITWWSSTTNYGS